MTHAADFAVDGELEAALSAADASVRALKVRIENECFVRSETVAKLGSQADDFASVKGLMSADKACYVLFRTDGGDWSFMSFVPDDAPVKEKMIYSSAKDTLSKKLGGPDALRGPWQHWSDLDDVQLAEEQSATARKAEQDSLLSDVERLKIEGDRLAAIEAAGSKVTSAGLKFPITSDASAALADFASAKVGILILAIDREQVVLKASAPPAEPAALAAMLPAEPCYCLYRWSHSRAAEGSAVVFMYMCPEDAPVRGKMLHASSKGAILASLPAHGVEVAKTIEGLEPAEISEAELTSQLYGDESAGSGQPQQVTKAAPRGGRKLVRKPRPEAE